MTSVSTSINTSCRCHLLTLSSSLQTHFEAGDNLSEEVPFFTATGDPAGFNIVDLLAWGSLGHATGFALLAAASNNYENFVQ